MAVSQEKMLQAVYDALFGAFTKPPKGAPLPQNGLPPDKTYLSLNWPGLQVDINDFADPWHPNNTEDSMFATENLSALVDDVPEANAIYNKNGNTVAQIYKSILSPHISAPTPDPRDVANYNDAVAFLTQE